MAQRHETMNIHTLYNPFLSFFRSRRKRLFNLLIRPSSNQSILDVGGCHLFWEQMECHNTITCLNLKIPQLSKPVSNQFNYVQGDGRYLPYSNTAYDIVFSNSVIEHLGCYENQKQFAAEIRRVGKSYWVQTPNRWFLIEPHLITPLIHYLPKTIQKHLLRRCTIWGLVARPTRNQVDAFLSEIRLLNKHEMSELFPDATILSERILGFTKSFIAVKK